MRLAPLLLLLGCAEDACDAMCDAALDRYEICMAERGLAWGMAYADAADYRDACATWVWERRQLGEPDTCAEMEATFTDGDCAAYDAAWQR